jgi:hypothetical protein
MDPSQANLEVTFVYGDFTMWPILGIWLCEGVRALGLLNIKKAKFSSSAKIISNEQTKPKGKEP